ncbi:MAG: Hpt domain-containing protein [Steroidobacteraceae bacterium]
MSEVGTQTLQAAAREISVSLADARTALEAHVEQPDNLALLERCVAELHQVQGALRMLEIYGAALLAEEMEQVGRYLIETAADKRNHAEVLDALMRAMVQLPGYLERVLAGGRDLALVLLPLLNDLRAVRGSALLSEGTLLLLNLKSDRQAQPAAPAPGEPPLNVAQWARRLRARFQGGLIGWIRGERTPENLELLGAVANKIEQIATQQPVFQLWWVTGALIEALRENGLEGSVSVKRLLGLADRELKRIYDQGEFRYAQSPPVELLNNLLYYVARATTNGPRVAAVRASFRLSELLPVDESIEQERENLSAPSVKLMHTVAAAIREDLTKVKDVLDLFVRRGGGQGEEIAAQIEMLRKIGDTLGVLGLGDLRARVQEATTRLEAVASGRDQSGDAALVQIAAELIKVEDHLDDQLVGLILPRAPGAEAAGGELPDEDFQQVQAAVLRECVVNLARVKEAVAQNVTGTLDALGFDSWAELMRGIKAGLLMLGKGRAVDIVEGVTQHLRRVMQPGGTAVSGEYLDRLADAIVSVEYYIETLQAGRSDPWYMLDNAQTCLEALSREPERVVPTVPALGAGTYEKTVRIAPPKAPEDLESTDRRVPEPPVLAPARAPAPPAPMADADLVQLFIEEAHEEIALIQRQFPVWDQNPLDADALAAVRRSFHTLKGSGRMVGARELGEFAWSMENLLNRIISGTLVRSPAILEVLRDSVRLLPALVAELEAGQAGRTDTAALIARAHALAAGRDGAATRCHADARGAARRRCRGGGRGAGHRRRNARGQRGAARHAGRRARRRRGSRGAGRGARTGPGAARHLRARDLEPRRHGARLAAARAWPAGATRADRGGLSRQPHAGRQLAHGRGAPWHPPGRAAQPLAAQVLRQRRRPGRLGPGAARRLHGGDGAGRRAPGGVDRLLRRARHAARTHRAHRGGTRPPHRRGRGRAAEQHRPEPGAR